ncbi:O-antigen ligase family protein [Prosthecomicrobium sp. N25]|uniref:O-antigen ligase family protein n=1 Tax=Prosthecomicrobium sp. N25 TaxID=3129254 RepID=UPI003076E59E
MSAAVHSGTPAAAPGQGIALGRVGDVMLFLGVFSGSVVMFEPAPYDLILAAAGVFAFLVGLAIPRAIAPLVVLVLLFNIGGLLVLTQPMVEAERSRMFVAVSFFLAFTCVFFAATVAERPYRLNLIVTAMIGAAVVAALLGIAGYLGGIEALTRYDRAKGAFKDPNVFGPFLILPLLVLAREFMTRPVLAVWWKAAPIGILLLGVLFSFSRAAWFLALFGLVALGFVVFLVERRPSRRLRLILVAGLGALAIVMLLGVLLSDPQMREFFLNRAKLVQEYDGGRLGRLARHFIGFLWAAELPLGLGPLDFAHYFTEDPHNVYLKAFLGYGWLGGLAYPLLTVWTLAALFPLMFRARPWQPYAQCVFVALLGHVIIGWIIDSDHWRHFFLLWGLAWGMIALEAKEQARRRTAAPA